MKIIFYFPKMYSNHNHKTENSYKYTHRRLPANLVTERWQVYQGLKSSIVLLSAILQYLFLVLIFCLQLNQRKFHDCSYKSSLLLIHLLCLLFAAFFHGFDCLQQNFQLFNILLAYILQFMNY